MIAVFLPWACFAWGGQTNANAYLAVSSHPGSGAYEVKYYFLASTESLCQMPGIQALLRRGTLLLCPGCSREDDVSPLGVGHRVAWLKLGSRPRRRGIC